MVSLNRLSPFLSITWMLALLVWWAHALGVGRPDPSWSRIRQEPNTIHRSSSTGAEHQPVSLTYRNGSVIKTFNHLVANTLLANTANNFLWFALTFWVYIETRSVVASSVIGGGYMLLFSLAGVFFGSFVDRHSRKSSMLVSSTASFILFGIASIVYFAAEDSLPSLSQPETWVFVILVLAGAIAGNLRAVALATTVTLLVPADRHDRANGLVGTANGVAFALTSVFSGLAIGLLGMGPSMIIALLVTALVTVHLLTIRIEYDVVEPRHDAADGTKALDLKGAVQAVRVVPGLFALLLFSTFNNFVGGVFMALMDPYGLELVSVETWGIVLSISSFGFIVGGLTVASRGLGPNPVRALLLVNVALWTITILFPIRSSIIPLAIGFFLFTALIPVAEASEQTIIQRVVPFHEQGRVFGFAQTIETAASPLTAFLIGPIAQAWVIPFMTDGAGADAIGDWFGTGRERGMALIFIIAGAIGLVVTVIALNSRAYRNLSERYIRSGSATPADAN
jgi:DHA3 family multidrug efflux protein-like MFS transporter